MGQVAAGTLVRESVNNLDINPQANISRTKLGLSLLRFGIPLTECLIHNTLQRLTATPSGSVPGLIGSGTWGTDVGYLRSVDLKVATSNIYTVFPIVLPDRYEAGQPASIEVISEMVGDGVPQVADASAVIDLTVYKSAGTGLVSGTDLVATSAQNFNTGDPVASTFVLNAGTLSPGDHLWGRLHIASVDAATASAIYARIYQIDRILTCRG